MSFKYRCDCEYCKEGLATTHNDQSHDQSLDQTIIFNNKRIRIRGGTTKCARVFANYLQSTDIADIRGKNIIEVGSGTGLVGIATALCEAKHVIMTDQEPVMDILQANIDEQPYNLNMIDTVVLQWGQDNIPPIVKDIDIIIGSDLIFAHENIPPLIKTIKMLLNKPTTEVWYASIRRFHWEDLFFEEMNKVFRCEEVFKDGDISILKYKQNL